MSRTTVTSGSFGRMYLRARTEGILSKAAIETLETRNYLSNSVPGMIQPQWDLETNSTYDMKVFLPIPWWAVDGDVTIDWGDGSTPDEYTSSEIGQFRQNDGGENGSWDDYWFLSHAYEDNSAAPGYNAVVTIDSSGYGLDTYYCDVMINNYAPDAILSNSGPINEGGTVTVSIADVWDASPIDTTAGFKYSFATSTGALAESYATASGTATANFSFPDDGNKTIYARVFDKDDGYNEYSTVVTVSNVAPFATLAFSDPDASGNVTVSLTNASDPSSDDASAGFKYSFNTDYNSLASSYASASSTSSQVFSASQLANGAIVYARIFDDDGVPRPYQLGVTNMSAQVVSSSQINLTWTDDVTNELGWRVQWSDDGSFSTGHVWYENIAAGLDHYEAIDVPDGTRRWFRVRAYSDGTHPGESIYSPKLAQTTILPAPDNLVAANLNNSSSDMDIEVSWDIMSQNQTGFTLKRFAAGVDVGTASPLETQNLGSNVNTYTFEGYEPGDLFQFTLSTSNSATSSSIPPVFENRTLHPGSWLDVYDGSVNEDYFVEATWTEPTVDPIDGPYYGAQKVELTLSNLPQHTYAWVAIGLDVGEDMEVPAPTAYVGETPLRMYEEDGYWVIELAPGGAGLPDAFEHSASDMTITIDMRGQDEDIRWNVSSADVQVYFPLIGFTYEVDGAATEGYDGKLTVGRFGADGTEISEPMQISLQNLGGSASGADYNLSGNITIPAGYTSVQAWFNVVDDQTPEWTEDVTVRIPKKQSQYSRGDESLLLSHPDIFDRKFEIVDNDLMISSLPTTIWVNNDDDNDNGVPDNLDTVPFSSTDDDLISLQLTYPQIQKAGAKVTLSGPGDKVRFWQNQDRSGWSFVGSRIWIVGQDWPPPTTVYVEPIGPSEAVEDIAVSIAATDAYATSPPIYATSTQATTRSTGHEIAIRWASAPGGGKDVQNARAGNVIVGQYISLIAFYGGPFQGNTTYAWAVDGDRIANFSTDNNQGVVTPLQGNLLTQQSVDYYWINGTFNGQDTDIRLNMTVGQNQLPQVTSTFKVFRPTTSIKGTVVAQPEMPVTTLRTIVKIEKENLNIPPGFTGETQWVQLVTSGDRRRLDAQGWKKLRESPGLDGNYPYPKAGDDFITDSPSQLAGAGITSLYASDAFRDTYMFKPTNLLASIYVPLRVIDWSWTATAVWQNNAWQVTGTTAMGDDSNTTDFPVWTHNNGDDLAAGIWDASQAP